MRACKGCKREVRETTEDCRADGYGADNDAMDAFLCGPCWHKGCAAFDAAVFDAPERPMTRLMIGNAGLSGPFEGVDSILVICDAALLVSLHRTHPNEDLYPVLHLTCPPGDRHEIDLDGLMAMDMREHPRWWVRATFLDPPERRPAHLRADPEWP